MDAKINQSQINSAAWAACDTFRGVVDPSQYKDYILVILFLKYISDVWRDHYENYSKQYGDDEERIRRKLDRERFVLPKGASFYDLYTNREADDLGDLINKALDVVETQNKGKLEGVFRNIDFNSESNLGRTKDRNRRLKLLLEDFAKPELDMRPSRVSEDVIGNTYIYLIEKFASDAGKKAGEFYTPYAVSTLLAKVAKPKDGDKICDPACGSGGLLIEAAREVGSRNYALFGMEVNGSTWALARMNMFLHGCDSARIEWCNTLTNPELKEQNRLMKFNVVVANPPFSLDKWGAEDADGDKFNRFWRGIPPKSKGDYAFISHMIEVALAKEGRVAVVVPHGVLFRGGAEGKIRQKLIEENLLDTVIGLPEKLFPTTGIPVAILVFDRSREPGGKNQNRKDILFIEASQEYEAEKNQNILSDSQIEKIMKAFDGREEISKFSHLASFEEVKENDFNLNIPRYVDTFEEEEEIDVMALQNEIESLETELTQVRSKMKAILLEIKQ
ncbi:putative type I restriction enzymeP M protein [Candidatus Rubidus massiliensis]|nr:putative type I restriction enzymeP M protein [Candidatus Rubidus massiliensis]